MKRSSPLDVSKDVFHEFIELYKHPQNLLYLKIYTEIYVFDIHSFTF